LNLKKNNFYDGGKAYKTKIKKETFSILAANAIDYTNMYKDYDY